MDKSFQLPCKSMGVTISSVQSLSCVRRFETTWTVARLSCPSPTSGACSDSCPSSRWCHPTISSSVASSSSCLQPFAASGSFPVSQFFASGGQSTGASASASVLPINIQGWFLLGQNGWISLQSKRLFKSLLQHHSSKASILQCSAFFIVQLSHPYITTGKTIALTTWTFVGKVMSLLFNMLSKLFMGFISSSDGKASTCNAGDQVSIPGSGRSPGEGNGNPLLYSCLENPTDRGAWWATIYGVAKSDTTEQLTHTHKLFIAFLPRSKRCLISWLQSPSAVILEPKKIKSVTVSIVFPSICMK